jgi:hypothetical protein
MDDYAFAGLVTIAVALFAMGIMDILAVIITTLSNMLWRETTNMSDTKLRKIADAFFEKKQNRELLKDAITLEEARRAAAVKNLYRLRSLRLSRDQAGTQEHRGWAATTHWSFQHQTLRAVEWPWDGAIAWGWLPLRSGPLSSARTAD